MDPSNQPVAVVTGASRGIGRAIADRLSDDGYAVVINYVRNQDRAEEFVEQLDARQQPAIAVRADVAHDSGRRRLIDAAFDAWGRLDLLVNNAGITSPGRNDLLQATEESWDLVFSTNLKGPFFLSQYAANRMLSQTGRTPANRGQIINISSISAYAVSHQSSGLLHCQSGACG